MKYIKLYNENENKNSELCKFISHDDYQYWRSRITNISNDNIINIIKIQIKTFLLDYDVEFNEDKMDVKNSRITYNGNPIYGPTDPELKIAFSYCGDEYYLVEVYFNWYFYTLLCDDIIGLKEISKILLDKVS